MRQGGCPPGGGSLLLAMPVGARVAAALHAFADEEHLAAPPFGAGSLLVGVAGLRGGASGGEDHDGPFFLSADYRQ